MSLAFMESLEPLIIKEQEIISINDYQVEVLSYLGVKTADVHHFKVKILLPNSQQESPQYGLLRVGGTKSALEREIRFRAVIGSNDFTVPMLASIQIESAIINLIANATSIDDDNLEEIFDIPKMAKETISYSDFSTEADESMAANDLVSVDDDTDPVSDRVLSEELEEEYYPETPIGDSDNNEKILILTSYPHEEITLKSKLKSYQEKAFSTEDALNLVIPFCQVSLKAAKLGWFFVDWVSDLITFDATAKFFDLTSVYPATETLISGISGDYSAPELASALTVDESMVSYSIGALLYQTIHGKMLNLQQSHELEIQPISRIYQVLKIALSSLPEERFPLSQLLSLLVTARMESKKTEIEWQIASQSVLGLSLDRLQNEDNYGFRQYKSHNGSSIMIAAVADGMGGMARGEEASKIAIKTVLETPLPEELKTPEQRDTWLLNIFQQANKLISEVIKNGGTTLSMILAVDNELSIAHVGDSRIYLLRNEEINQLSEDHSLVGMMVANGEITEEESLIHPDRNVLIKSLGSKKNLANGYVQNLMRTVELLSMKLEQGDILLLCSDGVWDLVGKKDFSSIFISDFSLDVKVGKVIEQVLHQGASDNATLLATKFISK
jgi:PPM family protein phosphatase